MGSAALFLNSSFGMGPEFSQSGPGGGAASRRGRCGKKNDKNVIERSVPRPFWPPWSTTPRRASAETARVTNVANRRFFVAYLT